jgi:2-keto-3-deoxy-L-rhamnonate aldolase RhmA
MDSTFLSAFLQNVLMSVGVGVALSLIGVAVSLAKKLWAEAKATNPDLFAEVERVAALVVAAAEQAGIDTIIEDKKKWALDLAEKFLATQGIVVDLDLVAAAIEAAVKDMKDAGLERQSLKSKQLGKK